MKLLFSFTKHSHFIFHQLRYFSNSSVRMAAAAGSFKVYIPKNTIPTARTKITLADHVSVSPLSKEILPLTQLVYMKISFLYS